MIGLNEHSEYVRKADVNKLLRLAAELGIKTAVEPRQAPASSSETPEQRAKREIAAAAGAQRVEAYKARMAHHFDRIGAPFQEADIQGFVRSRAAKFRP